MLSPMIHPDPDVRVVKGACPHDCPDTCALETTVQNGVAIKVAGSKSHPFTDGALCTKVSRYLDRTYAPDRVVHPQRRVGGKGPGQGGWERITWDEALTTIAAKFHEIIASPDGPEAICPYSYAGTMGQLNFAGMDRRFFHHIGASLLDRTLCSSAGKVGIKLSLGGSVGMDPERVEDSRLILIWGSNPITSNLHYWTRVQEAKRRGARVVVIDPYRSLTAEKGTDHLAVRPGTDAALALAMMHVIINEDRHDADYVARHTVGFEALRERVQDYPPARAADICGLAADDIVALARDYATTRPSAIRVNYGLQRHKGGGAAVRAITCLPALVGAWRDPAGGVLLSTGDFYGMNTAALERQDLLAGRRPRTINTSSIGDALLEATPPIRALYVYNSNPVTVAPDSEKVVRGFARTDLFTVVHDVFFTDTADYADIFLPATTQLECLDVHKSYGHLYVLLNQPAIAPVGEALPNTEVFRRMARAMGLTEPALFEDDETMIRQALDTPHERMRGITFEQLREHGLAAAQRARDLRALCRGRLPDAVGQVRVLQRDGQGDGPRSAAHLHAAGGVGAERARAGPDLSAGDHLAAAAPPAELVVCQPAAVPRQREGAAPRHPSRRCRRARHHARAPGCASSMTAAPSGPAPG